MLLRDGSETEDPRLDRLYELDYRSLDYPVTEKLELRKPYEQYYPRSFTWAPGMILDQGPDGACVGFMYAADLLARPYVVREFQGQPVDNKFAKEQIYWPAQMRDEWAGGSYPGAKPFMEGSSILAGAKVMQEYGFYESYYWGLNLQQVAIGVGYEGPCCFGSIWTEDMFEPDANGFVWPTGRVVGGHAYLIYKVRIMYKNWVSKVFSRRWDNVDLDKSFVEFVQSWGVWGINGTGKMTLRTLDKLLMADGDACFPNRVTID